MKKFKNKIAVKGPKSLLKAFEEELINLGYKKNNRSFGFSNYIEINTHCTSIDMNGEYTYSSRTFNSLYHLPENWDLALKLAAEVEEEIPEYIECITPGYIIDTLSSRNARLTKGTIYKVSSRKPESSYPKKIVIEVDNGYAEIGCREYEELYKTSTKEAYEAQSKPQVGKWYKLEDPTKDIFYVTSVTESGVCYGYGFISGNWFYHTDEKSKSSNCACNEVAFRERAKPATDEEVERALVVEAQKRYPLGCYYNHENNVAGPFLLRGTKFTKWVNGKYPKVGNAITERNSTGLIFSNGKWAEIVKQPLKIYDYDVQYNPVSTTVKIGCKEFKLVHLKFLRTDLKHFNFSIELSIDNYRITEKDLDKIIEFCK